MISKSRGKKELMYDNKMTVLKEDPITVLTRKPASIGRWLFRRISLSRETLLSTLSSMVGDARVDGPAVVRINLLKGLDQIDQVYQFDPPSNWISPYVGILSDIEALHWAIEAKREGRITRLVAGPNLVTTPLELNRILCAPEIDVVVTPCRWVSEWYVSLASELEGRVTEWAVGIDTDYWSPDRAGADGTKKQWLIYDKTDGGKKELNAVRSELERRGLPYDVIVYGEYSPEYYRRMLRRSIAMVVLSPSESQGLAQFEAWSCDVPTLIWDRRRIEWMGMVFDGNSASSSPYLDVKCGMRFRGEDDLSSILEQFIENIGDFTARDYVLQNFSLEKTAQNYIDMFKI